MVGGHRSVAEMPRPWRDPRDPGNLRLVARMLALHRSLVRPVDRRRVGFRDLRPAQRHAGPRDDGGQVDAADPALDSYNFV